MTAAAGIQDPAAVLVSNIRHNRRHGPESAPAPEPTKSPAGPAEEPTAGPVPAPGTGAAGAPGAAAWLRSARWHAVLARLRASVPAAEYNRVLRYALLLEVDPGRGWALVGVPHAGLQAPLAQEFGPALTALLSAAWATPLQLAVAVLPGQGRLAAPRPTLTALLAAGDAGAP